MNPSLALFYVAGVLCVGGALGVVATRNIVYGALFLLTSLLGIAGVYILLLAEFLALVQILIYGGAVIIVILFAIMLTRSQEFHALSNNRQWPFALVTAIIIFAVLATALFKASPETLGIEYVSFKTMSTTLFNQWAVPFEIASLVLLVALIGAVVLARDDELE